MEQERMVCCLGITLFLEIRPWKLNNLALKISGDFSLQNLPSPHFKFIYLLFSTALSVGVVRISQISQVADVFMGAMESMTPKKTPKKWFKCAWFIVICGQFLCFPLPILGSPYNFPWILLPVIKLVVWISDISEIMIWYSNGLLRNDFKKCNSFPTLVVNATTIYVLMIWYDSILNDIDRNDFTIYHLDYNKKPLW